MKDVNFLKNNDIDVDEGLNILGDMEMYNDTLKDFLDVSTDRLVNLKKYYEDGDMANYRIEVHALKGDSKYLGFHLLADMALEHQLKSEDNDINYIKSHYNELIDEYNRIINVVSEYLGV